MEEGEAQVLPLADRSAPVPVVGSSGSVTSGLSGPRSDGVRGGTMEEINRFVGPHRFLSNFWPVWIRFEGEVYPTLEHAYQAAKTIDLIREGTGEVYVKIIRLGDE